MATKEQVKTWGLVATSLVILATLGYNVSIPEPNYYCESQQKVGSCFSISGGAGTLCYTLPGGTGGKKCTEGWKSIDSLKDVEVVTQTQVKEVLVQKECPKVNVIKYDYDGTKWLCNDEGQQCNKFTELLG